MSAGRRPTGQALLLLPAPLVQWLATVILRVVQADDDAYVRLMDEKTGERAGVASAPAQGRLA